MSEEGTTKEVEEGLGPAETQASSAPAPAKKKSKSKAAADDETTADPEPAVFAEQDDQWSRSGPIPSGATGPTVSKIRVSLGLPSAGRIDRQVSLRVRRLQLGVGLAQTGLIDVETRKALNV